MTGTLLTGQKEWRRILKLLKKTMLVETLKKTGRNVQLMKMMIVLSED